MFNKRDGVQLNDQKYPVNIFVKESYLPKKLLRLMLLTNITVANF